MCITGWPQANDPPGYEDCRHVPPCPARILDLCLKPLLCFLSFLEAGRMPFFSKGLSAQWMPFFLFKIYFLFMCVGVVAGGEQKRAV